MQSFNIKGTIKLLLIVFIPILLSITIYFGINYFNLIILPSGKYEVKTFQQPKLEYVDSIITPKELDLLPSNYDSINKDLSLNLTQIQKSQLLNQGYLKVSNVNLKEELTKYSNKDIPITLDSSVYTKLNPKVFNNIEHKIREEELRPLIEEYFQKLLLKVREKKSSLFINPEYLNILNSLEGYIITVQKSKDSNDLLTNLSQLYDINESSNYGRKVAVIDYLTKEGNLTKDYSKVATLLKYLDYDYLLSDLVKVEKYLSDEKISNLATLLSKEYDYDKIFGSVVDIANVEQKAACSEEYVFKDIKIDTSLINLDKYKEEYIKNLNELGLSKYVEEVTSSNLGNTTKEETVNLINSDCSKLDLTTNLVLNIDEIDGRKEMRVLFTSTEVENIQIINENFNNKYDYTPTEQANNSVRIPILMYHQIANIPSWATGSAKSMFVEPSMFEKQLAYLVKMNYKTLTSEEFSKLLVEGKNPTQKSIMLTFDDGVTNHYTNAYPLLKKYGLTGVFYVISNRSALKTSQIKEMSDNGMVIDSHSRTHMDLQKQKNYSTLYSEIFNSKVTLENVTGKKIYSIAYPYCVANSTTIGITSTSGYSIAGSCGKSIDHKLSNRFTLSRIHVDNEMETFKKMLSGIR